MWCASIDLKILANQHREGLWAFNGRTKRIQREAAKKNEAMDRAAAVALRRLDGEPDESPDASYALSDEYDDDNYLSEDEQFAVDQQGNETQR